MLNGAKAVVLGGPWADKLIVSARISGDQRDRDGVGLFIVDKSADGVARKIIRPLTGARQRSDAGKCRRQWR